MKVSCIDGPTFSGELKTGDRVFYSEKELAPPGERQPGEVPRGTYSVTTEWKCAARPWIKSDPPQDCDWPVCGCDPYATKVIEALEESGLLRISDAPSLAYVNPDDI